MKTGLRDVMALRKGHIVAGSDIGPVPDVVSDVAEEEEVCDCTESDVVSWILAGADG